MSELQIESMTVESLAAKAWPIIVDLKTPIDLGKSSVSRIELRRGRLGDLKGMQLREGLPADHMLLIASRLSGQPLGVIERLDMDDSGEVMAAVMDFYVRCLGAGSRP
jgi:hypothetical protein